jgi:tRNA-binding protein
MPSLDQFHSFEIRVGTVVSARPHPTARNPALQLEIDFGKLGVKQSSARITARYAPSALQGRQVAAVVSFPARRVAGFRSDVLVLAAIVSQDDVVLLTPDSRVPDGTKIGCLS